MKSPGKLVVDEFYVHLSSLLEVSNEDIVHAVQRVAKDLPRTEGLEPNIAKVNLRIGRVSLLAYPQFFDDPFPALAAAWVYQPGATSPSSFRRYDGTLNPPILHRKERLISAAHPDHARWEETTKAAEAIGLFDEPSTIGFRLNWERLIASKGYRLVSDEFLPIGNDETRDALLKLDSRDLPVQRHLTALSRTALSAPVQLLIRHGLLTPSQTLFDYGCGRGGDVSELAAQGYNATGWDPHFSPGEPQIEADLVNLGFVVNVIEDPAERIEALTGAFQLARKALVVSVMLYGHDTPGRPFRDGFVTSRNTFQKYFSQAEFKDYLENVLARPAFMVGPGVAFVFASNDAEQQFSAGRYRSNGLAARMLATRVSSRRLRESRPARKPEPARPKTAKTPLAPTLSSAELRLAGNRPLLDKLWALALDLGRFADPEELPDLTAVLLAFGSLRNVERHFAEHYDLSLLHSASTTRADDLRLFMATQQFAKRPAYRQLEARLQRDIKVFFGNYRSAQEAGLRLLVEAAEPANILAACIDAAARGYGWLDGQHSLQIHRSMVERLPTVLRAFVSCGLILWDSLTDVQLVKIHIGSGKLTLLEFDDFDESPIPSLRRRIKVHVRHLDYEVFEYGSAAFPKPNLYRKSRYLNEDYPRYAEQLAFDEAMERHGLISEEDRGPSPARLPALLSEKRLAIKGVGLTRSDSIPDLESRCGANFRYRDFIECGATQKRLGVYNVPVRPETYNALFDLATELLDPLIDYFGSIRLTYGFASAGLTKHIAQGIAPRLDQHAACDHNSRHKPICDCPKRVLPRQAPPNSTRTAEQLPHGLARSGGQSQARR